MLWLLSAGFWLGLGWFSLLVAGDRQCSSRVHIFPAKLCMSKLRFVDTGLSSPWLLPVNSQLFKNGLSNVGT